MDYLDIFYIRDIRIGRYVRVLKVLIYSMLLCICSIIYVFVRFIIYIYMLGVLGKENKCMFVYE